MSALRVKRKLANVLFQPADFVLHPGHTIIKDPHVTTIIKEILEMHFITLLAVFIAIVCPDVLGSQQTQFVSTGPSVSRSKSNELTPWQWCEGCVRTVSVFGVHLAREADRLMKIHQVTPVDPDTKVDMNCEIPDFQQYQDFVKVSCGIIVKNNHESVVEVIRGTEKEVTMSSLQDVRVISAKSRQVSI